MIGHHKNAIRFHLKAQMPTSNPKFNCCEWAAFEAFNNPLVFAFFQMTMWDFPILTPSWRKTLTYTMLLLNSLILDWFGTSLLSYPLIFVPHQPSMRELGMPYLICWKCCHSINNFGMLAKLKYTDKIRGLSRRTVSIKNWYIIGYDIYNFDMQSWR